MAALFKRGAFDEAAAREAGAVLAAYAVGLPAVVLIRSAVASFYARSDTKTPLIASLTAVAINIAFKIVLTGPYGVAGLALGTALGAWINLVLLFVLAYRRDWTAPSAALMKVALAVTIASILLALFAFFGEAPAARLAAALPRWRAEAQVALLGAAGAALYGIALLAGLKLLKVRLPRR